MEHSHRLLLTEPRLLPMEAIHMAACLQCTGPLQLHPTGLLQLPTGTHTSLIRPHVAAFHS